MISNQSPSGELDQITQVKPSTKERREGQSPPISLHPLASYPLRLRPAPAPIASIIGRESELAALQYLLDDPAVRLVTITGMGGVGKTRLLLACLHSPMFQIRPLAWTPLATIRDPALFLEALSVSLGVQAHGRDGSTQELADVIGARRLLLALDNMEHLLSATAELAELMELIPGLQVVVTSRSRLNIPGEHVFVLPPLAVPESGLSERELRETPAIALFVDQMQAATQDFPVRGQQLFMAAEIVRRLDGVPLAIEMAANKAVVLGLGALLGRLDQPLHTLTSGTRVGAERHQTMRRTIAWSAELLSTDEQAALRRLAVFHAPFTPEAAEYVVNGRSDQGYAQNPSPGIEAVITLVEHHLLARRPEPVLRFRMLETIREYAIEQLAAHGEVEAATAAHAGWYEEVTGVLLPKSGDWRSILFQVGRDLSFLEAEMPNLRDAFRHFESLGKSEALLQFAAVLQVLAWYRGRMREIWQWHERALDLAGSAVTPLRCFVSICDSLLAVTLGEDNVAVRRIEEGLAMARHLEHPYLESWGLKTRGLVAGYLGNDDDAIIWLLEAHRKATDNQLSTLTIAFEIAAAYVRIGRIDDAKIYIKGAEEDVRAAGFERHAVIVDLILGTISWLDQDRQTSRECYLRAIEAGVQLADPAVIAEVAMCSAAIPLAGRDFHTAARLLGAADALREVTGRRKFRNQPRFRELRESVGAALPQQSVEQEFRLGSSLGLDSTVELVKQVLQSGETSLPLLTKREISALSLMAEGLTDAQIGDRLFISRPTASNHVAAILRKLGARSRAAAITAAHRGNLLQ